jgi:hypothetical protein
MYAAVYEKFSTLKVFRMKFLYAFLLLYTRSMKNTNYEECRYAASPFPPRLVTPLTTQPHVAHSAMCSRTVWQFTKCHTLSDHLVQSWFCTVWCFLVQTADGTTEDSDANASIDCCQLLRECFIHLWLPFTNILPCHVSKDLLVFAKFYVIHTVNILTFPILKSNKIH